MNLLWSPWKSVGACLCHGMCRNRTSTTLGWSVWEDLLGDIHGGGKGCKACPKALLESISSSDPLREWRDDVYGAL